MNITIKKLRTREGTLGWLQEGLSSTELIIVENISENNKLGLWLKEPKTKRSCCLAIDNVYQESAPSERFRFSNFGGDDCDPLSEFNIFSLTPASQELLREIKDNWAKEIDKFEQEEIENLPKSIKVSFK